MVEMRTLTPEQQRYAENHYGLLLAYLGRHHLPEDYYGPLAEKYLKTVKRYSERPELHRYTFSTILWFRLDAEVSKLRHREARHAARTQPLEQMLVQPSRHDDYAPDFLWHEIGQQVTQRQLEMLRLKSIGLTAKEISELYSCTPKSIYCRVYRLKKKLRKKAVI